MRCTSCGSEAPAGARFCTNCGASFSPVATTPGVRPSPTALPVAPSGFVYLFGDRFAGRDKLLSAGEKLPCSDVKVQKKELVQAMFRAAFASLERDGHLSLTLGQKKALLFKTSAVFVTLNRREVQESGGLETRILHALTGDPRRDCVEEVVGRVIGEDSIDPWGVVIDQTREYLLQHGYFVEGERGGLGKFIPGRKLLPQCERIIALQRHLSAVQALLEGLPSRDSALNKQLCEDIKRGIALRYETQELDVDE